MGPFPELSLEILRAGPVVAPGSQEISWADNVYPTPSGKIELLSREAVELWGVDGLPDYSAPTEQPGEKEASAYPLQLLTPNTMNRIHSQFGNLPSITHLDPAPVVDISPVDAAGRGIGDGDRVRVFNDRGSVTLEARFDHSLRPGCLSICNGWWLSQGCGINLLSAARETDMAHGAAFHDNGVEVERAE